MVGDRETGGGWATWPAAFSSLPAIALQCYLALISYFPPLGCRWMRFDDGQVFFVSQQQVLVQRPYLLFYQRVV